MPLTEQQDNEFGKICFRRDNCEGCILEPICCNPKYNAPTGERTHAIAMKLDELIAQRHEKRHPKPVYRVTSIQDYRHSPTRTRYTNDPEKIITLFESLRTTVTDLNLLLLSVHNNRSKFGVQVNSKAKVSDLRSVIKALDSYTEYQKFFQNYKG